mmetsp:Transcript_8727/g.8832  ORF Transcript_8727/g.8832 Transcript_8727/m.8832 type:complete len:355 (+) Transcript_8727:107-1171(+)|eukprot:CAMPEP_0182429912 /NCGR_PEP_ID=MMETSP1167-20130531/35070_1 /TAXON_ID=2988 /ORGANISM="Mallomonas Sp, Strain CCMP3275" /LENGTH=354 /DNA_ID=CAMNT_0024614321 /DNA_START=46 /DNA_END=1110 /DNA_ORIENTATION=+
MTDQALLLKVKNQIEFYFSDSNFRRDTFLRAAAASDPDGFVPIATLLTFNKLKSLTTDPSVIVEALKDSTSVLLNEEKDKIRRASALSGDDTTNLRTLYVKGLPLEEESTMMDDCINLFSKYGKVNFVRLRRDNNKAFKGSCFIEFSSVSEMEAAIAAAAAEDDSKLTFKGTPFESCLSFADWRTKKQNERNERKGKKPVESSEKDDKKRKRDDEDNGDIEAKEESKPFEYTKGLIFKMTNIPTDLTTFQIKDAIKEHVDVRFVDYTPGESKEAYIRLGSTDSAQKLATKFTEGLSLIPDTPKVEATLLEGEEERVYWQKIEEGGAARAANNRGGRGGRGRGRGRGRGAKHRRH